MPVKTSAGVEKPSRTKTALCAMAGVSSRPSASGGSMTIYELIALPPQPPSWPLVVGTRPAWRGSISMALRSERATALKQVSAIWWQLLP